MTAGSIAVADEDSWAEAIICAHGACAPAAPSHLAAVAPPVVTDERVLALVGERAWRVPALLLARNGVLLDHEAYTYPTTSAMAPAGEVIDPELVREHMAAGASVIMRGLEFQLGDLQRGCARIGDRLGCHVQANAYRTPAGGQGFDHHYDVHAAVVWQQHGRKRWRLWPPLVVDPVGQVHGSRLRLTPAEVEELGPPVHDVVLGPGDVLHLPRGWVHDPRALDEPSLHLTLGLRGPTRHDLAAAALNLALREVDAMRETVSLDEGLAGTTVDDALDLAASVLADADFREATRQRTFSDVTRRYKQPAGLVGGDR